MSVMQARHADHAGGPKERQDPPWPATDPLDQLEALFWTLDLGRGYRIELLEGQIVVSPKPVLWHGRAALWLYDQFREVCKVHDWDQSLDSEVELPATRDIVAPDQMIFKNPGKVSDLESAVPVEHVLLVSEVVSPSSQRADREVKPLSYAKAGIPFYLLVDRFVEPATITLLSEPEKDGYAKSEAVAAGQGGRKLRVPKPFGITLDATTLPAPRG
jgi:Uma2 family endonuclease